MNRSKPFLRTSSIGILIGLFTACQPTTEPAIRPTTSKPPVVYEAFKPIAASLLLPTVIEYQATEGYLVSSIYRSTFDYDDLNRLRSITDKLVTPASSPAPWAQFGYTSNRLTSIDLLATVIDLNASTFGSEAKYARFELSYAGLRVDARLMLGSKEIQKSTITLDERGLPVKSALTQLFFDDKGNLDWIADSKRQKELNPIIGTETIEQRYDANRQVYSQVREMQLLEALLSSVNRRITGSGITGLGSSLNVNNLVYTKRKNYDPNYGCREIDELHINALSVNEQKFPTHLLCHLGAFGPHEFTIAYKRVD